MTDKRLGIYLRCWRCGKMQHEAEMHYFLCSSCIGAFLEYVAEKAGDQERFERQLEREIIACNTHNKVDCQICLPEEW